MSLSASEAKGLDVIARVRWDAFGRDGQHRWDRAASSTAGPDLAGLAEIGPHTANGLEQLIRQLGS